MLLEELMAKAAEPAEYDWEAYYRWFLGELAGGKPEGYSPWLCRKCLTVNLTSPSAAYGTCRGCGLTYIRSRALADD